MVAAYITTYLFPQNSVQKYFFGIWHDDVENWYYKLKQLLHNQTERSYYKIVRKSGIRNCNRLLLQGASVITNCDRLFLQGA